ncbi:MAG TPA: hypothetical protein VGF15_05765 [Solirubrobacteraceae bacterium]
MSWLQELADELTERGVTGPQRRRIVLELQDHIACEPGCENRLGDPLQLAARFANELASDAARRCALGAFGALASAAIVLILSQATIGHAGGYPGFDHGLSLVLFVGAALGMLIAPQVALVAGGLAGLRALRRGARILPASEIALIRRRAWVGLAAGIATMIGLELYVGDFSAVLPAWWLVLFGGLAATAGLALLGACARLVRTASIVSDTSGPAGDLFDDLPVIRSSWLRQRPWHLGALAWIAVALSMTVWEWYAEHSLAEGLQRGAFEGLAAAAGFALLGRSIGVARTRRED